MGDRVLNKRHITSDLVDSSSFVTSGLLYLHTRTEVRKLYRYVYSVELHIPNALFPVFRTKLVVMFTSGTQQNYDANRYSVGYTLGNYFACM